jgi:hypothetical protein
VNSIRIWIALVVTAVIMTGCATGSTSTKELRRIDNAGKLPLTAKVGMTNFSVCGGAYLDRLKPAYHEVDSKAILYLKCSARGYPALFQKRLRSRLEQKLGRKLTNVYSDKPFKANQVFREAERLGLDYVISGDQLYIGENAEILVADVLFYVISVKERKIIMLGQVKRDGSKGKLNEVIDAVADELFTKAYLD